MPSPFYVLGKISFLTSLLLDSTLKGTLLLVLALILTLLMRRDSAATRYFVWRLAIIAILAAPVLSALLPQWRVLPSWARLSAPAESPTAQQSSISAPGSSSPPVDSQTALPLEAVPHTPVAVSQSVTFPESGPKSDNRLPHTAPVPVVRSPIAWSWAASLPWIWGAGFASLILRLVAARWTLWKLERRGAVIDALSHSHPPSDERLLACVRSASQQLGLRRTVVLLISPDGTIPIVWGLWRVRLMLPASAYQWDQSQLQSVLLHELAHVRRRDMATQLLTQFVCAIDWFNPLVWYAARRLGIEREQACDDLVLTCGVRPSEYASHLLEVASGSSPAASWALAMARPSSLEGRLMAILSKTSNRRSVSVASGLVFFAIAATATMSVAILGAADERPTPAQTPTVPGQTPADDTAKPNAQLAIPLKQGLESHLQWGSPVHGLRAALVRSKALDEDVPEEIFDFKLVLQNLSDQPIRFNTLMARKQERTRLLVLRGEQIMTSLTLPSTPVDILIQPHDIVTLRLSASPLSGESITGDAQLKFRATLEVDHAADGNWKGTLATADTGAMFAANGLLPRSPSAKTLFSVWTADARRNGTIPGGWIGMLDEQIGIFIKNNPTWKTTDDLVKFRSRMQATRDWTGEEALALLDDLADIQESPISMALDYESETTIRAGTGLPPGLGTAPWGNPASNGLRLAWLLEPRSAEHRLNTPLSSRVLIHNAGKYPMAFRAWSWRQGAHQAHDSRGAELKIESTHWLTRGLLTPVRLAPGEMIEVLSAGIGVGANKDPEDWQNSRVGSWIDAKPGDQVTVTTAPVPLSAWNEPASGDATPDWWRELVKERLRRRLPFPADADERRYLLYRVALELFGTPVSDEINVAFIADNADNGRDALDSLAKRLIERPEQVAWTGSLQSGPTSFRVLPPDPDAARRPRTAIGPGEYTLNATTRLKITRRPVGSRIVNEAVLQFSTANETAAGIDPYPVRLPDDYDSWGAAWIRGDSVFWITQKEKLRKIDFSQPKTVREAEFTDDQAAKAPLAPAIRQALDALRAQLKSPDTKPAPEGPPPATNKPAAESKADGTASMRDDALWKSKVAFAQFQGHGVIWNQVKNGLRLGQRITADRGWRIGESVQIELWLHNPGSEDVNLIAMPGRPDVGLAVVAKDATGQDHFARSSLISIPAIPDHCVLPAGFLAKVKDFSLSFDESTNALHSVLAPRFENLQPGQYQLRCIWSDSDPGISARQAWSGELESKGVALTLR